MKIKLTVLTPKKQAKKSVETMKGSLLGFNLSKRVIEQKVLADNKFHWIMDLKDEKELEKVNKKRVLGEMMIRKFYQILFKNINRCNRLGAKFGKGMGWIKKQLVKRLRKMTKQTQDNHDDFITNIEKMSEPETTEFIKVNDRAAMDELLAKDLIVLEVMD